MTIKGWINIPIRILVVDDNRDVLNTYTKAILRRIKPEDFQYCSSRQTENWPLEVVNADSVSLAFDKLRNLSFEILVVDLKIPGMSGEQMGGLEVISESLKIDPLRPIIVVTGYGTVELVRNTLIQGVFDFIEKTNTVIDDLVDSIKKAIKCRNEKIIRSGNPFTRMTGLEPTIFGGRTEELEFFEQRLDRAVYNRFCEHFLVLGNWGIGKSTLFKEYKKICQSRGHIASVVPLEPLKRGATLFEAARSIVNGVICDLPYKIDRFEKVIKYFDSVGLNILGTGFQYSRDTSNREISPQAFLHETFTKLWQDIEDKTEVLVLLLDDLDNFKEVPEILMTIRQTLSMGSMKNIKILVGISSTPKNWSEFTSDEKHNPLIRYFISRITLSHLNENELRETIIKSLNGTGVSFSEEVIKQIYEYTKGHPFEMQVLSYHLFNYQLSGRVEFEVWDKALQDTISDIGTAVFDTWFKQASCEEAKILSIVANSEHPLLAKDIQKSSEMNNIKVTVRNIPKYLQRLVDKKILVKTSRGLYTIPDKIFSEYVRIQNSLNSFF